MIENTYKKRQERTVIIGEVTEISDPIKFWISNEQEEMKVVAILTDDNQTVFIQVQGHFLPYLTLEDVKKGDTVEFHVVFKGSKSKNAYHNNIVARKVLKH